MVFFVWALGPHLMVFGTNTGMILPQAFMRYVPLVANARLPGRAMVVVSLAVAVLAAVAVAEWRRRSRTGILALAVIAALVIADDLPAPFPLTALNRPAIYETLRDRPEQGAVGELPLGIRDGLAGLGAFEYRTMFHQTIHQRPMLGGMVSRLPEAVAMAYAADPLLATLLRLSASGGTLQPTEPAPDSELAANRLRVNNIRFIVLNTDTASPALVEYVERVLPLALIAQEGERRLYMVP